MPRMHILARRFAEGGLHQFVDIMMKLRNRVQAAKPTKVKATVNDGIGDDFTQSAVSQGFYWFGFVNIALNIIACGIFVAECLIRPNHFDIF